MAEVRWTNEAVNWLEDIHRHISRDDPVAAGRVVQAIYEKVQRLADFPEMGHRYRTEREGAIRVLLYGHYRIAYLVRGTEAVEILGIFHGALDIDQFL